MNFRESAIAWVIVAALGISTAAFAVTELPAPTGPYAIGRTLAYAKDDDRLETWTDDPKDHRELPLFIWYPADAGTKAPLAEYSPYPPDKIRGPIAVERGRGRALIIHTLANPPLAKGDEKFPVILFSGGSGSSPASYHALIEDLVSHGYIVVGMDHPYEGAGQIMGDGRLIEPTADSFKPAGDPESAEYAEATRAFYFRRVGERAKDAAMAISLITMMNKQSGGKFGGRIDINNIGMLGHSLGGVAAAHALFDVAAIKAGVNLDGHARGMPFDEQHIPVKPFLMVDAPSMPPTDEKLVAWKMTRDAYDTMLKEGADRQAAAFNRNPTASYLLTIQGAEHNSFSDERFPMTEKPNAAGPSREKIIAATRLFLLEFFDSTLKHRPEPDLSIVPNEFADIVQTEKFGVAADRQTIH